MSLCVRTCVCVCASMCVYVYVRACACVHVWKVCGWKVNEYMYTVWIQKHMSMCLVIHNCTIESKYTTVFTPSTCNMIHTSA